jgi:invasion protein IalB
MRPLVQARHRLDNVRRTTRTAALSVLAVLAASAALAQQPPGPAPAPKTAPKAPAPKVQPKQPAKPAFQAPLVQPQQQGQAPGGQPETPVVYSPWTKLCGKDQNTGGKEVCLTIKEAHLETGQFLAGAALIEQEGEQKKVFRITMPLGMQLPQGARVAVDQDWPISGTYMACLPNGCMADFEVNAEFVAKLKKAQSMVLQGINLPGQIASYPIGLADFAKANEGPPTDPKKYEESQRNWFQEMQKKAEEERKKREGPNGSPSPGGAAPAAPVR